MQRVLCATCVERSFDSDPRVQFCFHALDILNGLLGLRKSQMKVRVHKSKSPLNTLLVWAATFIIIIVITTYGLRVNQPVECELIGGDVAPVALGK